MRRSLSFRISMVGICLTAATLALASDGASDSLLPPNARPGECYARVFIPPTYSTESERMLLRDASEKVETTPAQFGRHEERVLVKEGSTRIVEVPAVYEWTEEKVLVKDASTRLEEVPAVYETVTETVVDTPEHTVWKKGRGLLEKVENGTGEVMCLVKVAPTQKTITKRVLKSPATTRTVEVPAEYKMVRRQVLKSPTTTRTIEIPAEYKTIPVLKQIAEPEVRRTPVPAEYATVSKSALKTDGKMEWRPVLCETNASPATVTAIQNALRRAGFDPGPSDGVLGSSTMESMHNFQKAKGLASGYPTLETLQALGVSVGA